MSVRMATRPMSRSGACTVVSGGVDQAAMKVSSKPTMLSSSGTRRPAVRAASITPNAVTSVSEADQVLGGAHPTGPVGGPDAGHVFAGQVDRIDHDQGYAGPLKRRDVLRRQSWGDHDDAFTSGLGELTRPGVCGGGAMLAVAVRNPADDDIHAELRPAVGDATDQFGRIGA